MPYLTTRTRPGRRLRLLMAAFTACALATAPLAAQAAPSSPERAILPVQPQLPAGSLAVGGGLVYEYSSALGHAGRLTARGAWQAIDWLNLELGLRFSLADAAPWDGGSAGAAVFSADAQYLNLTIVPRPAELPLEAGLRLRHNAVPGTAAGWWSLVPWNQARLGPIRALIGLDIQTWVDPAAPAPSATASPWGFQLLAALGLRFDLASPDSWIDLSVDTGGPWEPASFQALGLVLESRLPLAENLWLRPRAELRSAGATTMTNTFGRVRVEVAVEGVFR